MTIPNAMEDEEKLDDCYTDGGNVKWCRKTIWQLLIKPTCNYDSNFNPAIALQDFHPTEFNTYAYIKTCAGTSMAGYL